MSGRGAWLRRAALVLMVSVLALSLLTARAVMDGEREMRESDTAFNHGEVRDAAVHARRAAVLYAPGAPHVRAAYQRLEAIAVGAEAAGDLETAKLAWRAMRGAALETRHLWIPQQQELDLANKHLARIEAMEQPGVVDAHKRAVADLGRDDAPRVPWVVALVSGFALALLGLGWLGWRGVGRDGSIVLRHARVGVVLLVTGVLLWVLAILRA